MDAKSDHKWSEEASQKGAADTCDAGEKVGGESKFADAKQTTEPHIHYTGIPPRGISIYRCLLTVFDELLANEDAIYDMSMPTRRALQSDFAEVVRHVMVHYKKRSEEDGLPPVCKTSYADTDESEYDAYIDFYYTEYEEKYCSNLLRARVIHEGTHALRAVLILHCDRNLTDPSCLSIRTPERERKHMRNRVIREAKPPLFKLEVADFHSGYYMEHVIIGGIWVRLEGHVLQDGDNMVALTEPKEYMVIYATGDVKNILTKRGVIKEFRGLFGNWSSSGGSSVIYHSGNIGTRGRI